MSQLPALPRRRLLAATGLAATGALLAAPALLHAQTPARTTVVDLAGREVAVPRNPRRVVLGEGRLLYATAILDTDDPFARLAAWGNDLRLYDPDAWRRYRARFPAMEKVEELGSSASGEFSVERVIALDADLVILTLSSLFRAQEVGTIEKLERAGIPVIFVDFRENLLRNTLPSMAVLGAALGREDRAREFSGFYQQQTQPVYARTARLPQDRRPLVLFENAAGYDPNQCCLTWGNFNLASLVPDTGGRNWGALHFPGPSAMVNPEAIIADDPDVIVGTGANWIESKPDSTAVPLGYDATPEIVARRLKALSERPVFTQLKAVRNRRMHIIYHQFYTSPYHLVAVQVLAKWFQPELFTALDPVATIRTLHERFMPIPYGGIFWASLGA